MKFPGRVFFVFFLFFPVFILSAAVQAQSTRYVATGGSNSTDCTDSNTPCKTITFAVGQAANGDTIQIAEGSYNEPGTVDVDKNVTFNGSTTSATIVNGNGAFRVFKIVGGATVAMNNLVIFDGFDDSGFSCDPDPLFGGGGGGGILVNQGSTVTLNQVTLQNNRSNSEGGGICNLGTLTINSSLIGGSIDSNANESKMFGGGVYNGGTGTLVIDNSTVSNNKASDPYLPLGEGGGIASDSFNSVTLRNNTIVTSNKADSNGGGIAVFRGTLTVTNSLVINNIAFNNDQAPAGNGGGLYIVGSFLPGFESQGTLTTSQIDGNSAQNGGGIFNSGGTLTIDNSTISNNTAAGAPQRRFFNPGSTAQGTGAGGGGIFNTAGTLVIQNGSTIDSNHATNADGGGVYNGGSTRGQPVFFPEGVGLEGTAFQIGETSLSIFISQTTISNNTAALEGGGIYSDAEAAFQNVTISGNTATLEGGGYFSLDDSISCTEAPTSPQTLIHVTLANNSAPTAGGISAKGSCFPVNLKNTLLADNTVDNCLGDFISSQKHNLSDDGSCTAALTDATDMNNTDPNIGDLADNGGANTSHPTTHALTQPSPAIDAVDPSDCTAFDGTPLTVDERGFVRPGEGFGPNCDIGAFELQGTPAISVSPSSLNYSIEVGQTSAAQTVTVTNVGNIAAALTGFSLEGADAPHFAIASNDCQASLPVQGSCNLGITFSSSTEGSFSDARLVVASNASSNPDTVSLSGTATAASIIGTITGGANCIRSNLAVMEGNVTYLTLGWWLLPPLIFGLKRRKR